MNGFIEKSARERREAILVRNSTAKVIADFKEHARLTGRTFEQACEELRKELDERAEYREMGLRPVFIRHDEL